MRWKLPTRGYKRGKHIIHMRRYVLAVFGPVPLFVFVPPLLRPTVGFLVLFVATGWGRRGVLVVGEGQSWVMVRVS